MSVIVLGVHDGSVLIEDMAGELHAIPLAWHSAIDGAIHAGEVSELDRCTFSDRWVQCDGPALTTDLHDRAVCYSHAPDDNPVAG